MNFIYLHDDELLSINFIGLGLPTKEKEEEEDEVEMADMRVHGNHQKRVL